MVQKIRTSKLYGLLKDTENHSDSITCLMRYPGQLLALRNLLPQLIAAQRMENPHEPVEITIYSLACSTGEEPASIAAVVVDEVEKRGLGTLGDDLRVRVIGIDGNPENIAKARRKLSSGFSIGDTDGKNEPESLEFVNSRLGRINELGMVEVRVGDITGDQTLRSIAGGNVIFANSMFYQVYLGRGSQAVGSFVEFCGSALRKGTVVFMTEDMLNGRPEFKCSITMERPLAGRELPGYIYVKV